MSDYVIVTDSAADLSKELVDRMGVPVVSLCFTMDDKLYHDYPDKSEMEPKVFYDRLRGGGSATTNAVNVNDYIEALEPILAGGKDVCLIVFSSGLSSTYNSAMIAAEQLRSVYPQQKLLVSDSLSASMGQGLLVWLAVQKKNEGSTLEEVFEWVENHKLNICHQFTVDDLDFLKRGGRISGFSAALGGALSIKPILHVDDAGYLINIRKVRGRRASLKALVDKMKETAFKDIRQTVFISHGDCQEDADVLAGMVKESFPDAEIYINTVGPVIGAHTGPNVVTLFYQGEKR